MESQSEGKERRGGVGTNPDLGGTKAGYSALSSRNMLRKEGGILHPSRTEKQRPFWASKLWVGEDIRGGWSDPKKGLPCAWLSSWYGSWPIITTRTLSRGVYLLQE